VQGERLDPEYELLPLGSRSGEIGEVLRGGNGKFNGISILRGAAARAMAQPCEFRITPGANLGSRLGYARPVLNINRT
jgi:hypothetical protein